MDVVHDVLIQDFTFISKEGKRSMRSRRSDDRYFVTGGSESFGVGRLGWIGLICAAIGWALLLAEAALADIVSVKGTRPIAQMFHDDIFSVAKCLIGSGFGLAIVGGLQNGFGALNRFFRDRPHTIEPAHDAGASCSGRDGNPTMKSDPYRTLPDGSVEVETILGTRRFATMSQAREFI